ncbi:hypothetical protein DC498_24800 [Terrimonas sp.]|nr:hypothetical protein DC498_24800 [Terrimonas sp.]
MLKLFQTQLFVFNCNLLTSKAFQILFLYLVLLSSIANAQVISTIAGNGLNGFGNNGIPTYSGDGGTALNAQLFPFRLAMDSKGNIYLAQASAFYTVRKIDHNTGVLNTVVGNATQGYSGDGGPAIAAQLNEPRGIAFDSKDNLYIADYWNNCIRRVDAVTGIITTVAGDGTKLNGYTGNGGPAKDALLSNPFELALDAADNLYFTDFSNNCIRRIDAVTGIITTVAGSDPPGWAGFTGDGGLAVDARLYAPMSLLIDNEGDLIFSDFVNHRIRKISAQTGIINTIAGNGDEGTAGDGGLAIDAEIAYPRNIALDGCGNLYITSGINNQTSPYIRKVDKLTGIITKIAGNGLLNYSGDGGTPLSAGMNPEGLIFDQQGNMLIADGYNYRIRKVTMPPHEPLITKVEAGCPSSTVTFNMEAVCNVNSVTWNFGDPESGDNNISMAQNPTHNFSKPGAYIITATIPDGTGAISSQTTVVIRNCDAPIIDDRELWVPNAFTPNQDGLNDVFRAIGSDQFSYFEMSIYNRFGQRIFYTRSISKAWDGTFNAHPCTPGAYHYQIKYQKEASPLKIKSGSIMLIK